MGESDQATETQWVLRSQAGDRSAFEELVRRTARTVFARIYLDTARFAAVEDLVQETYLVAWRSIKQVTDPDGFRTWLLSIAHTVVIDAARKDLRKKRSGTRVEASVLGTIAAATLTPPQAAEREEDRQAVLGLLRGLPEEYRLPLMLRYLNGSDYESISQQLGLSNGSLRGLLNRGMAMLRERGGKSGLSLT